MVLLLSVETLHNTSFFMINMFFKGYPLEVDQASIMHCRPQTLFSKDGCFVFQFFL